MCGRYVILDVQEMIRQLREVLNPTGDRIEPNWNAAPSQFLPVLLEEEDGWVIRRMRWGLLPNWSRPGAKPMNPQINARSETAAVKPTFKSSMKHRRCIVPANGFYEWQKIDSRTKRPYYIHLQDESLMLMAGLYDEAQTKDGPLESFAILTTDANPQLSVVHDRMPVILDPEDVADWLSREETEPEPLERLLRPLPEGRLDVYEVGSQVNSVRNNDPSNIKPVSRLFDT